RRPPRLPPEEEPIAPRTGGRWKWALAALVALAIIAPLVLVAIIIFVEPAAPDGDPKPGVKPAPSAEDQAKALVKLQAARADLKYDEFAAAYDQLKAAQALTPDNPEILLLLARTARQRDMLDEAGHWLLNFKQNGGGAASDVALEAWLAEIQKGDFE